MITFDCYGIRKALGLTQKEMAEKIGVSTRAVQNYEAGRIPKRHIFEAYKKLQDSILLDEKALVQENINDYKLRIKQLEEENQKLKITIKYLTELL